MILFSIFVVTRVTTRSVFQLHCGTGTCCVFSFLLFMSLLIIDGISCQSVNTHNYYLLFVRIWSFPLVLISYLHLLSLRYRMLVPLPMHWFLLDMENVCRAKFSSFFNNLARLGRVFFLGSSTRHCVFINACLQVDFGWLVVEPPDIGRTLFDIELPP